LLAQFDIKKIRMNNLILLTRSIAATPGNPPDAAKQVLKFAMEELSA